jgi:hypothetical protein
MTREEAIDFGETWLELQEDSKGSNMYEFFKIAIQALRQKSCEDCLSRKAAVDAFNTFADEVQKWLVG